MQLGYFTYPSPSGCSEGRVVLEGLGYNYTLNRNVTWLVIIGKSTTFKITLTVYHRVSAGTPRHPCLSPFAPDTLEQIARCPPRRTDSPMVFCIYTPFLFAMQARNDSSTSPRPFEDDPIDVFDVFHTTRELGFNNDVGIDGTAE